MQITMTTNNQYTHDQLRRFELSAIQQIAQMGICGAFSYYISCVDCHLYFLRCTCREGKSPGEKSLTAVRSCRAFLSDLKKGKYICRDTGKVYGVKEK